MTASSGHDFLWNTHNGYYSHTVQALVLAVVDAIAPRLESESKKTTDVQEAHLI